MPKLSIKFIIMVIFIVFAISGISFVFLPGCDSDSDDNPTSTDTACSSTDPNNPCPYSLAYTEIQNFGCGTISFGSEMNISWNTTNNTITFEADITVNGTSTATSPNTPFTVIADWDDVQKNALIPLGSPLVWSGYVSDPVFCDFKYAVSFLDITFTTDESTYGDGTDPKTIQIEFEFDLGDAACGPSLCSAEFEVTGTLL